MDRIAWLNFRSSRAITVEWSGCPGTSLLVYKQQELPDLRSQSTGSPRPLMLDHHHSSLDKCFHSVARRSLSAPEVHNLWKDSVCPPDIRRSRSIPPTRVLHKYPRCWAA